MSITELEKILLIHSKKYPGMLPQDAVKLIYQNEFGGGHLIKDPAKSLEYLIYEMESVAERSGVKPVSELFESIGNGMTRVNFAILSRIKRRKIAGNLNNIFVRSASEHIGNRENFILKLRTLRKVTADDAFGFSIDELDAYLKEYSISGYPMVSHSGKYRELYNPAYRIVCEKYLTEFEI